MIEDRIRSVMNTRRETKRSIVTADFFECPLPEDSGLANSTTTPGSCLVRAMKRAGAFLIGQERKNDLMLR